jgi:nucleotide-binding universal stress UspA family protein
MSARTDGAGRASHEVLVITDLAPASTNAVWRAALIAREQGASLRLLHVGGERRRMAQVHEALEHIRTQVHARLGIELNAEVVEGDLLPKAISAARSAALLVIGPRRSNPLREWISGTQAERLIRLCRIPTLVVKRPANAGRNAALGSTPEPGRYGRVLVSVDLRPEAVDLVAAAMSFSRDAQTQIFHALGSGSDHRAPAAGSLASRAGDTAMQRAHSTLTELIRSSGAQKLGAVSAIAYGHAANCVLARERATGAELVVIGKRRRGLLADFILGGITQQVLAGSHADVLVVPSTANPLAAVAQPIAMEDYRDRATLADTASGQSFTTPWPPKHPAPGPGTPARRPR